MKRSIFIKNENGVVIELRQWGQNKAKWLNNYAHEWQELPGGRWEEQNWLKTGGFQPNVAVEIGRWCGDVDIYEMVKLARSNSTGFRNF